MTFKMTFCEIAKKVNYVAKKNLNITQQSTVQRVRISVWNLLLLRGLKIKLLNHNKFDITSS